MIYVLFTKENFQKYDFSFMPTRIIVDTAITKNRSFNSIRSNWKRPNLMDFSQTKLPETLKIILNRLEVVNIS